MPSYKKAIRWRLTGAENDQFLLLEGHSEMNHSFSRAAPPDLALLFGLSSPSADALPQTA
jgi:hypothetical protein